MAIQNIVCYSLSLEFQDAMAHLRLVEPLQAVGINILSGFEKGQSNSELIRNGDLVVVQREFPKRYNDYQKIVEVSRQAGKPIVFDMDDLLFFLPENHPDRATQYFAPSLLPMFEALMAADLVTVATPRLRRELATYSDKVVVLPNYFDDSLWQLRPPVQKSKDEVLTIGYMGGSSHKPDVETITPALLDLAKRFPDKVRFHFWGTQPPAELAGLPQVEFSPHYSYLYKDFSAFFQTQAADIFIAPLGDNVFNRCKSPLKFYEYSALGAPGVFSRLDPYESVVTNGQNGLLASSLDDWTDCLVQLIENGDLRMQLAANAQASIRENWLLSKNAFRWEEIFQAVVDRKTMKKEKNGGMLNILESMNSQLFETFRAREATERAFSVQMGEQAKTIQNLTDQGEHVRDELAFAVNELAFAMNERDRFKQELELARQKLELARQKLELLNAEVLEYVLSRSWRMTRPLRKITRIIRKVFRR